MSDKYLVTTVVLPWSRAQPMLGPINSALDTSTAKFVKFGDRWGYLPEGPEGEEWGVVIAMASVLGHDQTDILEWLAPVSRDFDGIHFECVPIG